MVIAKSKGKGKNKPDSIKTERVMEILIPSLISQIAIPLIIIFGFYIQFHGEVSPGGGFQSGIIFASAFIMKDLLLLIANDEAFSIKRPISYLVASRFAAIGVLIYSLTGIICIFLNGTLFDYSSFANKAVIGSQIGLTSIEFGVSCTVFGAMTLIYNSLVNTILARFNKISLGD